MHAGRHPRRDGGRRGGREELRAIAAESAADARTITTVTEVASGQVADTAIPLLLGQTAQLLLTGSRLGAIQDVVPLERFEADPGPDPDVDLSGQPPQPPGGLDEYADVVDPVTRAPASRGALCRTTWWRSSWRWTTA